MIAAYIIEDDCDSWMLMNICIIVETLKCQQDIVHTLNRWLPYSIGFVWHDALYKRANALFVVSEYRSDWIYELNHDVLIWLSNVNIIKTRGINQGHVPCSCYFYASCYRLESFPTFEFTCCVILRTFKFFRKYSCYSRECSWLALTAFTKNTCCPFIQFFKIFPFFVRILISQKCMLRFTVRRIIQLLFLSFSGIALNLFPY